MIVLRPSSIHGVGVFTTQPIAKGDPVLLFRKDDWRFIPKNKPKGEKLKMCKHYGVYDGKGYHTAKHWDRMSVGWFLNHSDSPNVVITGIRVHALRRIKKDEELVIDYAALGEPNE